MNVYRRYPARVSLALAAAVLVVVIGAASAFGRGTAAQANDRSAVGVSSSASSVGYGAAMPAWCCGGGTGMVPGLTTSGQAVMDGQGQDARDTAIAAAVKDATTQANVAADAAGIQLGAIIDMQVSAMPYYYGVAQDIGGGVSSSGAPGPETTKPGFAPDYMGSVSVTITWSLG